MIPLPTVSPARKTSPIGSSNPPTLGLTVGEWELVQLLGQGAMSRVFRAKPSGTSPTSTADYAVKLLHPTLPRRSEALERMRVEAHLGRRVSHPHLIPIFSAELEKEPWHLVMPYLEGTTVDRLLSQSGRLPPAMAVWIARQAAEALDALHRAGWIHGDVKPSNLHVAPSGHVTLLDLGLARQQTAGPIFVPERPFQGTLRYTAPELFTSTLQLAPGCDVYSLGATLYEMLVGTPPFGQIDDPARLVEAHQTLPPANPRQKIPTLHRGIVDLLERLLAKQPLRRPEGTELIGSLIDLEIFTLGERFGCR